MNRKLIFRMSILCLVLAGLGWWVLITPDNPLTKLFRGDISDPKAKVVIGPYPTERDLDILRAHDVHTIISLLDPILPQERVLLARERAYAKEHGMRFYNFPMASLLGKKLNADYERQAEAAADAIAASTGKVYIHCYLGVHRVKYVQNILDRKGEAVARYQVREGERSDASKRMDEAQSAYDQGRYQDSLKILSKDSVTDAKALILKGWSQYHLHQPGLARQSFREAVKKAPGSAGALNGLGYSALRENHLDEAEQAFERALKLDAKNTETLHGLGLLHFRENERSEAKRLFQQVLRLDPNHREAREMLKKIQGASA